MNKQLKLFLLILTLFVIGCGFYALIIYLNKNYAQNPSLSSSTFKPLNASYLIESSPVTLVNGKFETNYSPKTTTLVFGRPVIGDLNNDNKADAAMIITQDAGGSGLFYYVVVAIDTGNGAQGSNAVLLGDRIALQNIEIKNGQVIANYATRKAGEPMTATPSVAVSDSLIFNNGILKKIPIMGQIVTYLVSPEPTTNYCDGVKMDSAAYQKTITVQKTTSTPDINPSNVQIIKTVISAATTGMCHDVMNQLNITEDAGTVFIPVIDVWAGYSIAMCSCKPQVEVNLLQIPGIKKVDWSELVSNFEECLAAGNQVLETYPRQCKHGDKTFLENIGNELEKADLIKITNPRPNQTISSPVIIKGQARGSWFFEASFPVVLVDWDGKIIAEGTARTKSDWMTTDFIPYEATITFTVDKNAYSNKGAVILRKDNPSGLPTNDDSLEVPVFFAK